MAKLNKALQKKTASASDGFEPVEPGVYHLRLRAVKTDNPPGNKGPYWTWEFESVEPGSVGRRFWNNTSLSDQSLWVLKQTYAAFLGKKSEEITPEDLESDTDEFCGQVVRATISTRTIQNGNRKGQITNQVDRLEPASEDFEVPEEALSAASEQTEESIF